MIERRLVSRPVSTIGTLIAPRVTQEEGPRIVTEGLVGHWDAGNPYSYPGSGTTWTDLSGNGNNGTLTNGPTYSTDRGGSVVFDGTNDYIAVAGSTTISGTSSYTVEALVYHSTFASGKIHGYITIRTGSDFIYLYANPITSNTQVQWVMERNASSVYSFARNVTSKTPYEGTWVHVCGTYNGTTLLTYLNGVAGSDTATNTASISVSSIEIGRVAGTFGPMAGRIAVARVYTRALSAAEITQNFNAIRGRFRL